MCIAAKPIHSFLLALVLVVPGMAFADGMDDFKRTYHQYQKAKDDKNWGKTLELAGKALDQGLEVFQKDGQNVANLRFNYARELKRAGKTDKAAEQLKLCLDANEGIHGADAEALLGVLMELGQTVAASDTAAAEKYYQRAIRIADRGKDEALVAKLKFEAGLTLVKYEDYKDARSELADAHAYYDKRFGPKDARAGLAALNLGKVYVHDKEDENARQVLNNALKAFTGNDSLSKQFDIGTRRLLVPTLERMGRHDEATRHCIAIAMSNAGGGSAQPELLYRNRQSAIVNMGTRDSDGKEVQAPTGQVVLAYTIDATGTPTNISVQSSDNQAMNDTAVAFLKTFRYAPAVSGGKPVVTPNLTFNFHGKGSIDVKVER